MPNDPEMGVTSRNELFDSEVSPLPLAVVWAQYGPYHFARIEALRRLLGQSEIFAIELSNQTSQYGWSRTQTSEDLISLYAGTETETLTFWQVFFKIRKTLAELNVRVCLLPSYSPKQSLAAFLAAKSLKLKTVMMNDSHAGTGRAQGMAAVLKGFLVRSFDAALVAGNPHKRYFVSLGLSEQNVFTGYDTVDNDYFRKEAEKVRSQNARMRADYGLPEHYFLSLGRLVAKKNLATLIRAYASFLTAESKSLNLKTPHLVVVGSGEEEHRLRELCRDLQLPVYDHSSKISQPQNPSRQLPGVHFYGFRQIDENPVFYALADAFFLPSLYEEWGLVVNEAMACGLPVVVSQTAGCAEDLLEPGSIEFAGSESDGLLSRQARLIGRIRRNGFVVNPNSMEELTQAMTVLAKFPKLRDSMRLSSQRIIAKFSCEQFAANALRAARAAIGAAPAVRDTTTSKQPATAVARSGI